MPVWGSMTKLSVLSHKKIRLRLLISRALTNDSELLARLLQGTLKLNLEN